MPEGEESGKVERVFTRPISNTTCESRVCNKTRGLVYVVQSVNAYHNIKIEAEKPLVIPNLINLDMLVLKPGECATARVGSIVLGVEREWDVRVAECGVVDASPRGYRRVKCPSDEEVMGIIKMMDDEEWGVVMPYITAVVSALLRKLDP
jgi:hypothetical protein